MLLKDRSKLAVSELTEDERITLTCAPQRELEEATRVLLAMVWATTTAAATSSPSPPESCQLPRIPR